QSTSKNTSSSPSSPKAQGSVTPETLRRGLPEFIALLNDSDPRIQFKTLKLLKAKFFDEKDPEKIEIVTSSLPLMKTLVDLAACRDDADLLRLATLILLRASESVAGLRAVAACGYLNVAFSKLL